MTKYFVKPLNHSQVFTVETDVTTLDDLRMVIEQNHEELFNLLTNDGEISLGQVAFTCRATKVTYNLGSARLPNEETVTFFSSPRRSKGGAETLREIFSEFGQRLEEALRIKEQVPAQPEYVIPGATIEELEEEEAAIADEENE